ncbi:MAG: DUF2341 domain-containing protein [Candidatus Komeilibacteria bacterium]
MLKLAKKFKINPRRWQPPALIIITAIIIVFAVVYFLRTPGVVQAEWWNDGWHYRQTISLTNSGAAQTNTQVKILSAEDLSSLVTAGKLQSDLDDLRFTDVNGNILKHWIEDSTNSSVDIWAFIDSVSASGATIYMYYGNPSASADIVALGTAAYPGISCKSVLLSGITADGIYYIDPTGQETTDKLQAYCDMNTSSGGWTLIFQRRGGESYNNAESCGSNLNSFLRASCGSLTSLNYGDSYSMDIDYAPIANEYMFRQYDSNMTFDSGDAFIINSDNLLFPNITTSLSNIAVNAICDYNNANCDTTDTYFKYTGAGYFSSTYCNNGYTTGYGGNYGYCQNGISTTYYSNGLFGNRLAYDETKLWAHNNGSDEYMERVFVRESTISTTGHTVTASTPSSEEKGPGPIAYWKFDEGYGTTAYDSSSNNNNGSISGAAWQTEDMCVTGKCLLYNGTEYVGSFSDNLSMGSEDFTVSAWFKTNSVVTYGQWIVGNKGTSTSNDTGFELIMEGGRPGIFIADGSNNIKYQTANSYADNTWHFITATVSRGSSIKLYVDGKFISERSETLAGSINVSYGLSVGLRPGGGSEFNGFIDEVKIYPYARTATQIKADYLAGQVGVAEGTTAGFGSATTGKSLSDGLVGYWKMDEASWNGTSGEVIDSSGSGNNGTAGNEASITGGKFGNGGTFDGSNDYISIPDSSADLSGDFSVSMWVHPNDNSQNPRWFGLVDGSNTLAVGYMDDDTVYFRFGGDSIITDSTLTYGNWYYVTFVYQSNAKQIYINGEIMNTSSGGITGDSTLSAIGAGYATTSYTADGEIDEVRLYERALSAKEVRDLYNWAPGPVAYYNFDEKTGTTAYDKSGNGNNGTLTNMDAATDWVSGKYGSALDFDGVNDYVNIPDPGANSVFDVTQNLTISMWMNKAVDSAHGNLIEKGGSWWIHHDSAFEGYAGNGIQGDAFHGIPEWNYDLAENTWYYVSYTYNGVIERGYINGFQVWQNSRTGSITLNDNPIQLGSRSGSAEKYQGKLDEVKIYNYARTHKQIVEDMNAGHPAGGSPVASQLGYWKFDEGYGDTAYDSGFGGNDGTITGASWSDEGKNNKGILINSTDSINCGTDSAFAFGDNAHSFTAWVKPSALTSAYNYIVAVGNNTDGNQSGFGIRSNGNLFHSAYSAPLVNFNTTISIGDWSHLALIYENGISYVYVDGVLADSQNIIMNVTTGKCYIGTHTGGTSTFNDGILDEVKIYNYALTADEVLIDMNQGASSVMGNLGTDSSGNPDNSASRAYCVPGDTSTCDPPVAEWKFDEKTGTSTYDTSENNYTGTITNATWTSGKLGGGLGFNGTNAYVDCSDINSPSSSSKISIGAWVKWDTLTGHRAIFTDGGVTRGIEFGLYNDELHLGVENNDSHRSIGYATSNLTTDRWYNVAAVADGPNGDMFIYVDGVLVASDTALTTFTDYNGSNGTTVGNAGTQSPSANNNSGVQSYFHSGDIDNVRIYDYARTPAQIAWDFNRGAPVGWWKFDECEGSTVYDWAPSGDGYRGNDGTITIGGTGTQTAVGTCETSGTAWYNGASGQINSSLNFDGTDDYVDVPASAIVPGNEIAIAFWEKTPAEKQSSMIWFEDANGRVVNIHLFYSNGNTYWDAGVDSGGYDRIYKSNPSLVLGQWNHWVFTKNAATGIMKIYLNGKEWHSDTGKNKPITTPNSSGKIGSSNTLFYEGKLDDMRIYNYALTAEQIQQVMNHGAVYFK